MHVTLLQERFVRNVRTIMEEMGVSQSELASRLGVTRAMVNQYLRDENPPSPGLDLVVRFAEALSTKQHRYDPAELLAQEICIEVS